MSYPSKLPSAQKAETKKALHFVMEVLLFMLTFRFRCSEFYCRMLYSLLFLRWRTFICHYALATADRIADFINREFHDNFYL